MKTIFALIVLPLFLVANASAKTDKILKRDATDTYIVQADKNGGVFLKEKTSGKSWRFKHCMPDSTDYMLIETYGNRYGHQYEYQTLAIDEVACAGAIQQIQKEWQKEFVLTVDNSTDKVVGIKKLENRPSIDEKKVAEAVVKLSEAILQDPQVDRDIFNASYNYIRATEPVQTQEAKNTSVMGLIETVSGQTYTIQKSNGVSGAGAH
jgi:hypothetical protein